MRTSALFPPEIAGDESFDQLARKLATYVTKAIESPHSFDELKKVVYGRSLRPLVRYLVDGVHHEGVVSALLALRWRFSTCEDDDDRGVNETRAMACEIVAWRFVAHLTEREAIDYLCTELPLSKEGFQSADSETAENGDSQTQLDDPDERTPLLDGTENEDTSLYDEDRNTAELSSDSLAAQFVSLNALEIAAVVEAKHFMGEKSIQRVINGIWNGDIIFWDSISMHSTKKARLYNRNKSDPYCRLRVPLYLKVFEVLFFVTLLASYYAALIPKQSERFMPAEWLLYIWLLAFSYNEFGEFWDAGLTFYTTDFWSSWDLGIIATGLASFISRMVGIFGDNERATTVSFDILSVQALFLVPRVFSILSLHPYFGMLLPALKEMTKDFMRFIGLVAILYLGFDTTFTFLARGTYSFAKMNWLLVKVFFGSGYLDVADQISPILGPPLMLVFVCLTNILLITSLISLLSASLNRVMEHARDEYLFVYSVYVLEAATSNRLTYFLPPLNLVPMVLRPLRLILGAEILRSLRIVLLKGTHVPFVALILAYENGRLYLNQRRNANSSSRSLRGPNSPKGVHGSLAAVRKPALSKRPSPPLEREARTGRKPMAQPDPPAALETEEDLGAAVAALQMQLEHVALMIAKRKEANPA
ncbi:uncharacterized protein LTR77_009194 [Saxophila tyrrhenica]|uniref:Calcium channel YVC1-like C-terminal transmembrane domain-containing protein n=1 Tax=Saxophila tyrrhenica TaxID=1690608 RepID=A0AAV9P1T5_9PEZI|nr:hypothetical protein LTR77_009194 [Saxophila tyrrhenica]